MSRVYSQTTIPDDIYYIIMQFDISKIPKENSRFPFYDMISALLDIKTMKEYIEASMCVYLENKNALNLPIGDKDVENRVGTRSSLNSTGTPTGGSIPNSPAGVSPKNFGSSTRSSPSLSQIHAIFNEMNAEVLKRVAPENLISIRVSTPYLTWYEAKTRELTMKYTLNHMSHTSSWKVEQEDFLHIVSKEISFNFEDELLNRLHGTHEKKIEMGINLLKTAHSYYQEQRMREFSFKYDSNTMPELKLDVGCIEMTFEERSIQQVFKSENLVLKPSE